MHKRDMARPVPSIASCPKATDLRRRNTQAGRAGAQGSHQRALHMNAIVSPIPTKAYKPATVTPRQTSAMTLSGWSLICLSGIAPLLGCRPTRIDHAGGGKLFRFQGTKAWGLNGNGAGDISCIYVSVEIVHDVGAVPLWGAFWFSPYVYVGYLDIAFWITFIVFAAAALKQFSFRWLARDCRLSCFLSSSDRGCGSLCQEYPS